MNFLLSMFRGVKFKLAWFCSGVLQITKFAGKPLLGYLRSKRKSEQAVDEEMRRERYDLNNRNRKSYLQTSLDYVDTSLDIRVLNPK